MNCAPLSVGPPRCEPFPVLALEARTSHWVSIAANDRGTGPQEVLKARENQGCSRSIGPTRPCGRNPEIERVSGIFSAPVSPPRSALRGNRGSCGAVIIRPRHRYRKTRLLPSAASTVHSRVGTAAAWPWRRRSGAWPRRTGRTGSTMDRASGSVRKRGRPALPSASRVLDGCPGSGTGSSRGWERET